MPARCVSMRDGPYSCQFGFVTKPFSVLAAMSRHLYGPLLSKLPDHSPVAPVPGVYGSACFFLRFNIVSKIEPADAPAPNAVKSGLCKVALAPCVAELATCPPAAPAPVALLLACAC